MSDQDKQMILLIDDDENNLRILQLDLEDENYDIILARDGAQGFEILQQNKDKIALILTDRMMPNMNGIDLSIKVKNDPDLKDIPIIMQTAAAEKSQISEGIQAGIYYYITKPYEKELLLSVVRSALSHYLTLSDLKKQISFFKQKQYLLLEGIFQIKDLEDVKFMAVFLSNFYQKPEDAVFGISELLLNAVEHGNLAITYDEKTQFVKNKTWEIEVKKRLLDPAYADKKVNILFKKNHDNIILEITDQGNGFKWDDYLDVSAERGMDSHGRGIALSRLISFDSIEYSKAGNVVTCYSSLNKKE